MLKIVDDSDLKQIAEWCAIRNIRSAIKPSTLGLIEPGVAAAFLYITDSNWALIDHMIANPAASLKARDEALDLITMHIIEFARNLGCDYLYGITEKESVVDRAVGLGFNRTNKIVIVKEL